MAMRVKTDGVHQNTSVFEHFTGDDVFLPHESLSVSLIYSAAAFFALWLCLCILIKAVFKYTPNENTLFMIQEVFMSIY